MIRYSYDNKLIYFSDDKELKAQLDAIQCKRIIRIAHDIPDYTCTKHCVRVYYEIEIENLV